LTFIEAMNELSDGKKVRRKGWVEDMYWIFLSEKIFDHTGKIIELTYGVNADWELYEAPPKNKTVKLYEYVIPGSWEFKWTANSNVGNATGKWRFVEVPIDN